MGATSSKETTAVDKVANKAEKVVKSVSGDIKSAATDVKKSVDKAVDKTNTAVSKTGKEVTKAIDDILGTPKKDDDDHKHLKEIAVAVPVVALVVVGAVWLWKNKPWKKSNGAEPKAA